MSLYGTIVESNERCIYEKAMFKRGVRLLIEKGLVKRERRGWYMLNPDAILYEGEYRERLELWNSL